MHKTGACLPKLGQADPRWQALVLDPGLPPEQVAVHEEDHEPSPEPAIEDLPTAPAIEGKPRFYA